jgi:hypothetical protein
MVRGGRKAETTWYDAPTPQDKKAVTRCIANGCNEREDGGKEGGRGRAGCVERGETKENRRVGCPLPLSLVLSLRNPLPLQEGMTHHCLLFRLPSRSSVHNPRPLIRLHPRKNNTITIIIIRRTNPENKQKKAAKVGCAVDTAASYVAEDPRSQ